MDGERIDDAPWLDALRCLLHPLRPAGIALLEGEFEGEDMSWLEAPPARLRLRAASGAVPQAGWLIKLPYAGVGEHASLLVEGGRGLEGTATVLVMARLLARSAWRVRFLPPEQHGGSSEYRHAVHELRNGLNSVLMSSAVIAGARLPEDLQPFVQDLESAGRRSLRALTELTSLLPR
jgi:hypothetical protein